MGRAFTIIHVSEEMKLFSGILRSQLSLTLKNLLVLF